MCTFSSSSSSTAFLWRANFSCEQECEELIYLNDILMFKKNNFHVSDTKASRSA